MIDKKTQLPRVSVVFTQDKLAQIDALVKRFNAQSHPFAPRVSRHSLFKKFINDGVEKLDAYLSEAEKR